MANAFCEMRRLLVACLLFSFYQLFCAAGAAAKELPAIYRLGIEKGLSNNSVRCIYQDHNGFMWFGTYDGLNRYDGSGFKVFRNKINDSTSIPHNYIYALGEDADNNLLVGTGQGLCTFSQLTNKFSPVYYQQQETGRRRKISFNINGFVTDRQGNLYITTNGMGLLLKEKGQAAAKQIPLRENGKAIYRFSVCSAMDAEGNIWLYIGGHGLYRYNPSVQQLELVNAGIDNVHLIRADSSGHLWIGGAAGLYQYSIARNLVLNHYTETRNQLSAANVISIAADRNNNIWIGTEGGGVNILDPGTGRFDYILPGESSASLSSESVLAIYQDGEGRNWLGTAKGGIDVIDPQRRLFQPVMHDPNNKNSLVHNFASCFFEDADGKLWIGTDGGGLSIWNRKLNTFTNYTHDQSNPRSLSNNSVTSIKKDYLGNIWLSTYGGGINRFDPRSNSFTHYACINAATGSENSHVWALYEDSEKNFWATTFSNGKLYLLNRQANRFEVFNQELYDLVSIYEDRDQVLWVGNSHELIRVNKKQQSFIRYEIGKPVRAIMEDSKRRFWIGTEGGGLVLFDRARGAIRQRFSDANGLCNNAVLTILEDNSAHLWLSTFNGIARFNTNKGTFKNFYQSDGLQSNEFLYSSALRLRTEELVFGGVKGFNIFNPDSLQERTFMPPVMLTAILVNNSPLTLDRKFATSVSGQLFKQVTVPYHDAVFSFEFAALEYSTPGKINYAYMLEGWDKTWNYTKSVRVANYTNLPEGNYKLRIKSTNAAGTWNTQEAQLSITVLPPWYRSWWAYSLYAIAFITIGYSYLRYRNKQTRLEYEVTIAKLNADNERAEKQKSQAELQTAKAEKERQAAALALSKAEQERSAAELEKQRLIHEAEKELNEKRVSFFTSISHEFKTPLTLVINPVKSILDQLKESDLQTERVENELNIVYRNARRMLNLVDQLLLFRKAEADFDLPKRAHVDIYQLARDVYLYFSQQAKARNIAYVFDCSEEHLVCYSDRDKLEVILYNLLSNAFKYTPDGGQILLRVKLAGEQLQIEVKDNGAGIAPSVGNQLFERFYQAPGAKAGFGIGLYLVKQFSEVLEGHVSYTSTLGQGTSFFITLPAARVAVEHLPLPAEKATAPAFLAVDTEVQEDDTRMTVAEDIWTSAMVSSEKVILLIDDNDEIRRYLHHIFEGMFKVYEANSGEAGLKLARLHQPDIIISDVIMQDINGIDLCKTIKEDSSLGHIPVILLTGNESAEDKLRGVEGGADDYITKPFEKDFLIARVQNLLNRRTSLQRYFYNEITLQKNTSRISEEYKEFIDRCIEIVESHIEDDEFSIKTLTRELGMSYSKMNKKIKAISGQPANAFIRFIRLRKAAELFITTRHNVSETAFLVGIKDIKHFREHFYKLFGMKPSEYIDKYRKGFGNNYILNEKLIK